MNMFKYDGEKLPLNLKRWNIWFIKVPKELGMDEIQIPSSTREMLIIQWMTHNSIGNVLIFRNNFRHTKKLQSRKKTFFPKVIESKLISWYLGILWYLFYAKTLSYTTTVQPKLLSINRLQLHIPHSNSTNCSHILHR